MARPSTSPLWATDADTTVEPSAGQKAAGFAVGTKPPARWVNWILNLIYLWITWLDEITQAHDTRFANLIVRNWARSTAGSDTFFCGAGNGSIIVLAGDNSVLYTSVNGYDWTSRTSGFGGTDDVETIAWLNSLWLIGGDNGKLSTSADGQTWTSRTANLSTERVTGFAFGASIFVAVATGGLLSSSPTGATWTARTSQFTADDINAVAFGNGIFVAVGNAGKISSSPDGITWTARTSQFGSDTIEAVAYADGLFVAVGDAGKISTSPDGITWTARTSNFAGAGFIFNLLYATELDLWVAGGVNDLVYSADGINWTSAAVTVGVAAPFAYSPDVGLLCRANTATNTFLWSTDGVTWTSIPNPTTGGALVFFDDLLKGFVSAGTSGVVSVSTRFDPS